MPRKGYGALGPLAAGSVFTRPPHYHGKGGVTSELSPIKTYQGINRMQRLPTVATAVFIFMSFFGQQSEGSHGNY